jgi:hypothetical protein
MEIEVAQLNHTVGVKECHPALGLFHPFFMASPALLMASVLSNSTDTRDGRSR